MSNRKTSVFYGILTAVACVAAGMVIASKLDLAPRSSAGPLTIPSTNSAPITGAIDATTFRNIAKGENPAVVSIVTISHERRHDLSELFQFGQPGQPRQAPQPRGGDQDQLVQGAGSGFIIDKANGYVITNNHVVEGAEEIRVKLFTDNDPQSEGLPAKLIGRDVLTDSALIQITHLPKAPLAEARFGDSSQIQPGDWVMAIGNPFSYSNTVTVGVVSAVSRVSGQLNPVPGRDLEMIQTDAAINRGNSGGPLLNIRGEVVGINTAIVSDEAGGNLGIGFAVPINTVRDILPQLKGGKVSRGRIGVSVTKAHIDERDLKVLGLTSTSGAEISVVGAGGPADKAGVKVGDIVTEFNGKIVKDSNSLVDMVVHTAAGTTVPMKVVRDGKTQLLNVTVEELNVEDELSRSRQQLVPPAPDPTPEPKETGFGMSVEPLTPQIARRLQVPNDQGAAMVSDLDPRGAAARGGMAPRDVILAINGKTVTSRDEVTRTLEQIPVGSIARVIIWRGGTQQLVTMRKK